MLKKVFTELQRRAVYATKQAAVDMSVSKQNGLTPGMAWTGGYGRATGAPVVSEWSESTAIEEGMAKNHVVYRCMRFLAETTSSVPLVGQVRTGEKEWVTRSDLPLHQIVNRPNFAMSKQFMIENQVMNLAGGGNSLWWKIRAQSYPRKQKPVVQLWPFQTDKIKPIPSQTGWLDGYKVFSGESPVLPPEDILHIQLQNPDNPFWGMGPLQAASKLIDSDTEALTFWRRSVDRRCIKDGIISLREPLFEDQWLKYRDLVEEQLVGAKNAHGVVLIGEDAVYTPIAQTAIEMDYVNTRRLTREEIPAAFGVPPILVGVLDNASYSNFNFAMAHYWENTAVPLLEILVSAYNMSVTPEFGDPEEMRLWFDLASIPALRYDLGDRTDILKKVWACGCPFATANAWLNLGVPRFKGDDISYIQSGVLPADELTGEGEEGRLSAARRASADNASLPKLNGKKKFDHSLLRGLEVF